MATFVVRQSFNPPGGKRYQRGDRIAGAEADKMPAALLARCCTRVADDAFTPKPAPVAPDDKPATKGA